MLGKTDFDPATLWQWGTMQAMALIETLKEVEKTFGGWSGKSAAPKDPDRAWQLWKKKAMRDQV